MGRPRKDRGPTNVGVLQPLKKALEAEQAKARVSDDDDDMSDDEAIFSQQSQSERLFGTNGVAAQREKAEKEAAAAAAAASSKRSRPGSSSRKRKSASPPASAHRRSKRNANNSPLNYKDPADDDLPKPYNSDDDFQTVSRPLLNKDGSIPKRRGRPPKRHRKSEPVYISSQNARGGPSSQRSALAGSSQEGDAPRLVLDFSSPARPGKSSSKPITEEMLDKWKRMRNEGLPMHTGERSRAMDEFRAKVKEPLKNWEKYDWLEPRLGRKAVQADVEEADRAYFKEWHADWWEKRDRFIKFCEDRKKEKPHDVDPTVTVRDAKRWIREFLKEQGTVEQPEVPPQYSLPSKRRRLSRTKSEDVIESEADAVIPAVADTASDPADDCKMEEEEVTLNDVAPAAKNDVRLVDVVDVDAMPAVGGTHKNEDEVDEDLDDSTEQKQGKMDSNGEIMGKVENTLNVESVDLTQDEVKTTPYVEKTFLGFLIYPKPNEGTDDETDKNYFVFDDERSTLLNRRLN